MDVLLCLPTLLTNIVQPVLLCPACRGLLNIINILVLLFDYSVECRVFNITLYKTIYSQRPIINTDKIDLIG